jgi:type III pantothenate kinase
LDEGTQVTTAETIVAVDVGNSAVKVAVCHRAGAVDATISGQEGGQCGGDDLSQRSFPLDRPGWSDQICRWVTQQAKNTSISWWVSTVNHAASDPLRDAVTEAFGPANRLGRWQVIGHQHVPLQTEVDFPQRLGIDRLIGAYAATIRFRAPVIVVDAGSAVTVDWVRSDPIDGPRFGGGAILPGIRLQHAALATGTEGLGPPAEQASVSTQVRHRERHPPSGAAEARQSGQLASSGDVLEPGRNTEQAIRLGVLASVAGGIDRLAEDYSWGDRASTADNHHRTVEIPTVVLTGGDGPRISPYLRRKHALVPNLVCLGLMDLASRECQKASGGLK